MRNDPDLSPVMTGPGTDPQASPDAGEAGPASLVQEALWALESTAGGQPAYNECVAMRLLGALDVQALEEALQSLVDRHPALRSSFVPRPSGLCQQPLTRRVTPLLTVDIAQPSEAFDHWLHDFVDTRFDLSRGQLFRLALCRSEAQVHVLVAAVHHIAVDGWSVRVFWRDLFELYRARMMSADADLPALKEPPVEYARRQRAHPASPAGAADAQFWRRELSGRPASSALPRHGHGGGRAVHTRFAIEPDLLRSAVEMAARECTSPFVVHLTALASALARLTGRDDAVIGTDFCDRTRPELEPMIGLAVNQIPLRIRLQGAVGRELLRKVHASCMAAFAHKDLAYPMIVRACRDGEASPSPLFEIKFVFHGEHEIPKSIEGLGIESIDVVHRHAKFPVLVELWPAAQTLKVDIVCSPAHVDEVWVQRLRIEMLESLATLVLPGKIAAPALTARQFVPARRPVLLDAPLVRIERCPQVDSIEMMATATRDGVDLVEWASKSRSLLDSILAAEGALLLRGFQVRHERRFSELIVALGISGSEYTQRSTPRSEVFPGIYTSTEYPSDQEIFFHNENSYASAWPDRLYFWCHTPPASGGRTPIADCRHVLRSVPTPIRESFEARGLLYRRVYRAGLGVPWQSAFGVQDRERLSAVLTQEGYRFEWRSDGSLVTELRGDAIATHPRTREGCWFNHVALFHPAALPSTLRQHQIDNGVDFPLATTHFGNGDPIPDDWIYTIRDAYRRHSRRTEWQRDDVLLLDNMLVAHAREPYVAPRRILVSLAGESRRAGPSHQVLA